MIGGTRSCTRKAVFNMQETSPKPIHDSNASRWGSRTLRGIWWWGSVFGTLIAVCVPYWLWNIRMGGFSWTAFVRFPVAPNAVFDSYLYFQQMSLLKTGLHTGTFAWFVWPLRAFMHVLPHASIPEVWILTRWITTFLLLWAGAWCIRRLAGVRQRVARWLIVCFWLSFLFVIGLRPGAFSWYQPVAFVGIALLVSATDAGRNGRWVKAFAIGLLALGLLDVYPWFLVFGIFFLLSFFAENIIASRRLWFFVLIATGAFAACAYGILLASGKIVFDVPLAFAKYDRNGISLSHAPLISNTLIAILAWIGLLFAAFRRRVAQERTLMTFARSWIVLFVVWLSPLLLGIEYLIDHFILIVAMLSWITLAFFATPAPDAPSASPSPWPRRIAIGTAIFASAFFFYVLQKALVHIGKFEPYCIHLSIWLALAVAAWFEWMSMRRAAIETVWRRARIPLIAVSAFIGVLGLSVVTWRYMADMPDLVVRAPVIGWIQTHIPEHDAVCTDPVSARIYGAHDFRVTYPNESNLMFTESDDVQHRRLQVILAAYDPAAAGNEGLLPYLINGVRASACDQFARVARILRSLGWSKERAYSFIGCQEQRASAYVNEVMGVINAHAADPAAFRATCPWVIIPDDQKAYWRLPASYEEIRVNDRTSAWHVVPSE
jgi:hypothetical protein